MKWSTILAFAASGALSGCTNGRESRLLDDTDHPALLAACRRAMASLPPDGPAIDPTIYTIDPEDGRFRRLMAVLTSRTVEFSPPADEPWVIDPRLPPEILRLQPIFVAVTPDAVYIMLCGAGNSCSANAVRAGAGPETLVFLKGAERECKALVDGLWYCHE